MYLAFQYTIEDCVRAIEWLETHKLKLQGREPSGYEIVQYANLMYSLYGAS